MLFRSGVEPGTYPDHVALNDLAPTLAWLIGVEPPAGSQGRVLTEALRRTASASRPVVEPTSSPRSSVAPGPRSVAP